VNNVNAGTATASYTYAESPNHLGSTDSKNFQIRKAGLTITAVNKSKSVFQANPDFTVSYVDFVGSETLAVLGGTLSYATDANINSCAGTYDITPSGLTSSNYVIGFVKGTLTVNGVTQVDASASGTPVQIGSSATLGATVTPNVGGVNVRFVVTNESNAVVFDQTVQSNGSGFATIPTGTLGVTGVYKVTATAGSGCAIPSAAYIPVYDPNDSFVTGGGWINSPAGAMPGALTAVGKANFGFVSKYKKGSSQVDGNTEFQFNAGNVNFKSTMHESGSLVISGGKATYRGTGTINGQAGYKFMVVAIDGDWNSQTNPDQFRIKITSSTGGTVFYDNKIGSDDNSADATILGNNGQGGGSIVIHEVKKGNSKAQEDMTKGTPIIMEDLRPEILETLAASPNPVVSFSKVRFSLKEDANVVLRVYDYSGRMIETLYNGKVKAYQNYDVDFQRRNIMSGIYIVKLTTDKGQSYDKRIIVE
jgi:hypothetical protein